MTKATDPKQFAGGMVAVCFVWFRAVVAAIARGLLHVAACSVWQIAWAFRIIVLLSANANALAGLASRRDQPVLAGVAADAVIPQGVSGLLRPSRARGS